MAPPPFDGGRPPEKLPRVVSLFSERTTRPSVYDSFPHSFHQFLLSSTPPKSPNATAAGFRTKHPFSLLFFAAFKILVFCCYTLKLCQVMVPSGLITAGRARGTSQHWAPELGRALALAKAHRSGAVGVSLQSVCRKSGYSPTV